MSYNPHHRSVLETDFPTSGGPPRSTSRERVSYSLQRNSSYQPGQPNQPPAYSRSYSGNGGMASAAPDWQYQPAMGVPVITGRSGSLKKAYSDSSSETETDKAETSPLYPKASTTLTSSTKLSPQRSQISSTSDYHSDQIAISAVSRVDSADGRVSKSKSSR